MGICFSDECFHADDNDATPALKEPLISKNEIEMQPQKLEKQSRGDRTVENKTEKHDIENIETEEAPNSEEDKAIPKKEEDSQPSDALSHITHQETKKEVERAQLRDEAKAKAEEKGKRDAMAKAEEAAAGKLDLVTINPTEENTADDETLAVAVQPGAIGTRHEGFKCDFCNAPLLAMNTLHTDAWELPDHQVEDMEGESGDGMNGRHEGVRLCGECSVGHCPDCGAQLVPHLPSHVQQEGGRNVRWYTHLQGVRVIVKCPECEYEDELEINKDVDGESCLSSSDYSLKLPSQEGSVGMTISSERKANTELRFDESENESKEILTTIEVKRSIQESLGNQAEADAAPSSDDEQEKQTENSEQ